MDGKFKAERNRKLEKLKKLRSTKTHSNSFVLSNVSILKKSNIELAKKLSSCQADLLSYQEQYHVTWQQNVCLTLELKEYKRKLEDVEQMLQQKIELVKKVKYNSDIISNLLLSESVEGRAAVHSINLDMDTVPALSNKKPERIPINSADPNADNPVNVEEKLQDTAKQASSGRMFQCNKVKPSKIVQACSLKMVEEAADVSMNHSVALPNEETNKNQQPELETKKPASDDAFDSHNNKCKDTDSITIELNVSQQDVKKNEDDYGVLNSTTQALKLLPKQKKKRKKKTLRKCDDNNDDINISTININNPEFDKENFTNEKTIIENQRNLSNKPSGKAGGKKSVSFRQSTSSPLRLYLDPNDTISSEMHSDAEDLPLNVEPTNKILVVYNDSPSPTRGYLTEKPAKNRAQSYDNIYGGNSMKKRLQSCDTDNHVIENPAKKRAQSYDNTANDTSENPRRPRRTKAVSYKEPSLNKKMRRLK